MEQDIQALSNELHSTRNRETTTPSPSLLDEMALVESADRRKDEKINELELEVSFIFCFSH